MIGSGRELKEYIVSTQLSLTSCRHGSELILKGNCGTSLPGQGIKSNVF